MTDLIDRQAVIDGKICVQLTNGAEIYSDEVVPVKYLKKLPSVQPETSIQIGWICPVCGRGLSPLTSVCPCNNGKGWEITC